MDRDVLKHLKTRLDNSGWECEFCGHSFPWSVSIKTFRSHLTGVQGSTSRIRICQSVPDDVKEAAAAVQVEQTRPRRTRGGVSTNEVAVQRREVDAECSRVEGNWEPTRTLDACEDNDSNFEAQAGKEVEAEVSSVQRTLEEREGSPVVGELMNQRDSTVQRNKRQSYKRQRIKRLRNKRQRTTPAEVDAECSRVEVPMVGDPIFGYQGILELLMRPKARNSCKNESSLLKDMIERAAASSLLDAALERALEHLPPNESCSNLEPEAFPRTDLVTQDLRNCCLTVVADQHGVGDAEMVQQVQMVEGNQEGERSAFWTKRLVGEAFVKNEGKIWSWLMDDQVLRVGLYGMGGVGKTTLMRHIQTRLKEQSSFEVYWVTVSQDFSIWKLQNLIAKKIGLNFSDKEDEVDRAEKLTQSLKGKCILILDDLWNYFDVDKVGIPVKAGGCKLVLTTRLLNVCQEMDCNEGNIIQVQALSRREAWILFTKELGNYITEVEQLAKFVAIECDGLPLGIRVMARAMKGIREVHRWRNALEELRESKFSESHKIREEVFPVLKFSYLHLIDPALRKCLLYCALFPEDHKIDRGELIEYMIVEGIIDAKKSRRAELDRGHTMLDTLVNACLLEGDTTNVWMHDLIRDMTICELRERSNTLVEAGAQLKELPDVEEWTENLVCVSLMYNDIEVIPFRHTPRCPDLSTLLLRDNYGLRKIAVSFLEQFPNLKVLDLSGCEEILDLPVYVSDLVNLTALLLRGCRKLSHVPLLAKLERLKKLDLSSCKMLKKMPEGVELLINLKHLDLSSSGIERIGSEIIPNLSRLQVLNLAKIGVSVKGKELGRLEKLESLECNFDDTKEWRKYLKFREKSQKSLTHYFFSIGEVIYGWREGLAFSIGEDLRSINGVYILGGSSSNDYVALPLPTDIQALIIENDLNGFLWDSVLALKHTTQLHFLHLDRCDGIARLVNAPNTIATTPFLSNLISIQIKQCHKLKNLYPARLLPNLQNIRVWHCSGMEEVFGADQEGEQVGLNLPQLVLLELWGLQELRSIYNGAITCHSLQQIHLVDCPKLERITLPLPQPSLRTIKVYPKEWWESVQWGSANDKIHLQSLAGFSLSRYFSLLHSVE